MNDGIIKRGDLVEFTDDYFRDYPPQDLSLIRYGVCIADISIHFRDKCLVKIASGEIVAALYIYSYAWSGWIPDGLADIFDQLNPPDLSDESENDY